MANKKVPKWLKELFDKPEELEKEFDSSSLIEGKIKGRKVKVMHHKIRSKNSFSYKVEDYRFSPPQQEKQIKQNLNSIKARS